MLASWFRGSERPETVKLDERQKITVDPASYSGVTGKSRRNTQTMTRL
jgi:hypothetical protein